MKFKLGNLRKDLKKVRKNMESVYGSGVKRKKRKGV